MNHDHVTLLQHESYISCRNKLANWNKQEISFKANALYLLNKIDGHFNDVLDFAHEAISESLSIVPLKIKLRVTSSSLLHPVIISHWRQIICTSYLLLNNSEPVLSFPVLMSAAVLFLVTRHFILLKFVVVLICWNHNRKAHSLLTWDEKDVLLRKSVEYAYYL